MKWDNDEVIAAAWAASMAAKKLKSEAGKFITELDPKKARNAIIAARGNIKEGKALFSRQGCVACHTTSEDQQPKGPYLGAAGKFPRDYLVEAIIDPGAVVAQGFQTTMFIMADGTTHLGFFTREEGGTIEQRNIAGITTTLASSNVTSQETLPKSMMPPGLFAPLTIKQAASLFDYLQSLK